MLSPTFIAASMTEPHLLLAAGWNELISILVGLVFLVLWVLGQISDAHKKKQPPKGGRRPAPPKPAKPAGAVGGAVVGQQADPLRAQVDEFLRRAGQQRGPKAPPAAQGKVPQPPRGREEVVVLLDEQSSPPARRPLSEPLRSMQQRTPAPRRGESPPNRKARPPFRDDTQLPQSVAEHVAEHVGTSTQAMREEVSHLGERVIQADEQFDVQLEQKFDHKLGSLSARRDARLLDQQPQAVADSPASLIAAMLANPEGVRQAIIVNEILRRPSDRW